jgi:hypothetical protein
VPWSRAFGFAAGRAPLVLGVHGGDGAATARWGSSNQSSETALGKALETLGGAMLAFGWFDQNPIRCLSLVQDSLYRDFQDMTLNRN